MKACRNVFDFDIIRSSFFVQKVFLIITDKLVNWTYTTQSVNNVNDEWYTFIFFNWLAWTVFGLSDTHL